MQKDWEHIARMLASRLEVACMNMPSCIECPIPCNQALLREKKTKVFTAEMRIDEAKGMK